MKRSSSTTLNASSASKCKSPKGEEQGTVRSFYGPIKYLLNTYATDDMIAEGDACKTPFTQPLNESRIEYIEALWNKALRRQGKYDEYVLEDIYTEASLESIRNSMWSQWGSKNLCRAWLSAPLQFCWRNYIMPCATQIHCITTMRRITNLKTVDGETVRLPASIWTLCVFNHLEITGLPLDHLRPKHPYGPLSRRALRNCFHPHRQRRQ